MITSDDGRNRSKYYHWDMSKGRSARVDLDSMTENQTIHSNIAKSIVEEVDNTQERSTYYERNNDKLKRIIFPLKNGSEWIGSFHLELAKDRCIEISSEHTTTKPIGQGTGHGLSIS